MNHHPKIPDDGRHRLLLGAIITLWLAMVAASQAQTSPNGDWTDGFDNNNIGAQDSAASWIYWYDGSGSVQLDTTVAETGAGSLEVYLPFDNDGFTNIDQGVWFGNFDNANAYDAVVVYDGTQFTNIVFDILMDPSDPLSPNGDFGLLGAGLLDEGTPEGARIAGQITIPASAATNWFHCVIPIDASAPYLSSPGVIGVDFQYSKYDNSFLTNPVVLHIDNLRVQLGTVSNPPPVLGIKTVTPGLNFVQGSISSQYDRQGIATANGVNSSASYSWAGATAAQPVTYSFTISQFTAPDLNFHVFFYQTAGAGIASAADYNQPNVLVFDVSPNGSGAAVGLAWKTNSPDSLTTGVAFITNTPAIIGPWSLTFTSATAGTITAPGPISYPFTIDPSLAALIADPITVNFGIDPSTDSNSILGESVVISQISISGVDPLSIDYPTTDNFLADTTLDTNTWAVDAFYPNSILFVPANDTYSVNWTLPAVGLSLEVSPSLTGSPWLVPPSIVPTTLFPGENALIPNNALPAGSTAFFRLAKLTPVQLQVLLPGETNAPGTTTGKVGTPLPQPLYSAVTVTINEVDSCYNIVNTSDSVNVTSVTDNEFSVDNSPVTLINGTTTDTVYFGTGGPQSVTVSDAFNPNILSNTSSSVTVQ